MSQNKPCPFCGGKRITVDTGESERFFAAYCDGCSARAPQVRIVDGHEREAEEEAKAEWNKRVDATPGIPPLRDLSDDEIKAVFRKSISEQGRQMDFVELGRALIKAAREKV